MLATVAIRDDLFPCSTVPKKMKKVVHHTEIELMFRTDVAGTEMSSTSPQDGLLSRSLRLGSY